MEEEKGMIVYTRCQDCGNRVDYCTCNDSDLLEEEDVC
jgi:hypothetical protein